MSTTRFGEIHRSQLVNCVRAFGRTPEGTSEFTGLLSSAFPTERTSQIAFSHIGRDHRRALCSDVDTVIAMSSTGSAQSSSRLRTVSPERAKLLAQLRQVGAT